MFGTLTKLKIIACKDAKFTESIPRESFTTLLNPEQFSERFGIEYQETQGLGTSGSDLKFHRIRPETFDLDLLFDGTGVIKPANGLLGNFLARKKTVQEQIENFKKVALHYKGRIHSPRYLKISWGNLLFKGKLIDLNITYTLFKADGTPLRAKAKATFKRSIEDQARVAQENASSPDLTHIRTVKAGDTLPLMAHEIYEDASLYLEVARVNQLEDFRNLQPGTRLLFPPLVEAPA